MLEQEEKDAIAGEFGGSVHAGDFGPVAREMLAKLGSTVVPNGAGGVVRVPVAAPSLADTIAMVLKELDGHAPVLKIEQDAEGFVVLRLQCKRPGRPPAEAAIAYRQMDASRQAHRLQMMVADLISQMKRAVQS